MVRWLAGLLSHDNVHRCQIGTIVVVAKDMPRPLKYVPNDMEFLGVFQLPCGCSSLHGSMCVYDELVCFQVC